MQNFIKKTSIIGAVMILLCVFTVKAEDKEKDEDIVKNGNFEEWEWQPLDFGLKKTLGKKKENDENFNIEIKGLQVRWLKGIKHGTCGIMIEGENAYEGKSVFWENNSRKNNSDVIGLHDFFRNLIEPDKKYSWEIYVKGKGEFLFSPWVEGTDEESGKTKWLNYPNLIKVVPDNQWKKYSGTFIIDSNKYKNYRLASKISCAVVVMPGTAIFVDNFSILEVKSTSEPAAEEKASEKIK